MHCRQAVWQIAKDAKGNVSTPNMEQKVCAAILIRGSLASMPIPRVGRVQRVKPQDDLVARGEEVIAQTKYTHRSRTRN